jgi:hypothetical protein
VKIVSGKDFTKLLEKNRYSYQGIIACSIGNFVFNSPGRYRKMQAPPYSFIVKLHITENEGQWHVAPCFYPIVSDNLTTGFQVRPVTKPKDGLR